MFGKKAYIITMTGADRETIEEMESFLKRNNIEGKVVNRPIGVEVLK